MYRKRSDYRTMPLPEITDEFTLVVDHLLVFESATFGEFVSASSLTADFDKIDSALHWLMKHKFVRRGPDGRYRSHLRLRGLERRIWPREPQPAAYPAPPPREPTEPPKAPQGPSLRLVMVR